MDIGNIKVLEECYDLRKLILNNNKIPNNTIIKSTTNPIKKQI